MFLESKHLQISQISLSTLKKLKSHALASNIHSSKRKYVQLPNASSDTSNAPNHQPLKIHFATLKQSNLWALHLHGGPIIDWKSIGLEMRLHKYIHIHKDIWTMLGVRWSHVLRALPFITFLLFIGSNKQYGIILIPLRTRVIALL